MKKFVLALALAVGINSAAAPVRNAEAGILFLPFGVGVLLIVLGVLADDALLIVLDADGNLNQDALERNLAAKYTFIDDRAVVSDLASAIRAKAASTQADSQGRKNVRLDRAQVLEILEPTGLVELESAKVEALISDLG